MTREEALSELGENFNDKELGFVNNIELICKIFKEHEAQLKAERKKARSIVAMLFWEMKKSLKISNSSNVANDHGKTTQSFYLFKKAYAMLKDTK